jgi:hypothetical protein
MTTIPQIIDCLTTSISVHTFTLIFRPAIAVLLVHGAESLDEARAFAASILPQSYEVVDGDTTNGCVKAFHTWTCTRAQERMMQSKRLLSEVTDAELERMCNEVEAILWQDQGQLTEQEELQLNEALELGEMLELEQMRRLIGKVVIQGKGTQS